MKEIDIEIDTIAYDISYKGYRFKATYLKKPSTSALIEIFKGEELLRKFLFPAYKIWNIFAHQDDIIQGLEEANDSGIQIAASPF